MASIEKVQTGWRVVWRQDGQKQRERFGNLRAAEDFRQRVELDGGRWPRGWVKGHGFTEARTAAMTFGEWAHSCIAARSTANERTRHDYLRDYTRHIAPTFGDIPLDLISKRMVGDWLVKLSREAKLAPKTIKNIHNLASTLMAEAVAEREAPANPFHKSMGKLPTVRQEEMVFLSRGEFEALLSFVDDYHRPLVLLLAMTGLRWSEATALRVCDVDVMARRLTVVQAWKRTPESYFVIGEPKSRRSRRTITVTRSLVDVLLPLIAGRADTELLFLSRQGRPVRHANFRQRVWLRAIDGMQRCPTHRDLPSPCRCPGTVSKTPRIHDLRHSHISWLIAAGVDLVSVQRRAGHESITTTIDRYGHLAPESDDSIVAALETGRVREPAPAP